MAADPPLRRRLRARLGVLTLLAGLVVLVASAVAGAQPDDDAGPVVDIVEIEGLLERVMVGYLDDVLTTAEEQGSEVVVVTLDTAGGLAAFTEEFAERVAASAVPVVVWVGPSGAQATSAGVLLGHAAHVLAAAPGAAFGDAAPIDLADTDPDRDALTARLTALAEERGRAAGAAEAMAADGIVYAVLPDGAAAELGPDAQLPAGVDPAEMFPLVESDAIELGVVDLTAASLDELVRMLDGHEVTLGAGQQRTLDIDPFASRVRFNNPGVVAQVLHTVAIPSVAYLLIVAGALAVVFELYQPGFGVAGVAGLVLFGFGMYGLVVLPTNWLAFGLLLAGLALLSADLSRGGLGALTAAGTATVAAGSWLLIPGPAALRVPLWLLLLVTLATALFFVIIMTVVLRAQRTQAQAGAEEVVGQVGVVRSTLNPGGHVFVGGALWRAQGADDAGKVRTGTRVRVVRLNEEQALEVEPVTETAQG